MCTHLDKSLGVFWYQEKGQVIPLNVTTSQHDFQVSAAN